MSSPVSLNKPTVKFNEHFEDVKKIMKEEAQESLEKTSDQAKIFMKEKVDVSAKSIAPCITSPCKVAVNLTSTQPIASTLNTCITSSVEPVIESGLKKIGHKYVDQSVDTTAKKAINQGIDSSVDSTKSYFNMAYDYIQSKFY